MKCEKPVLVVEDDKELCESILRTLKRAGYRPCGAHSIQDATSMVNKTKFACILVDISLGNESGADLIDYIRLICYTENIRTPIVVISGHLDRAVVERIKGKVQGALVKPFDIAEVLKAVEKQAG